MIMIIIMIIIIIIITTTILIIIMIIIIIIIILVMRTSAREKFFGKCLHLCVSRKCRLNYLVVLMCFQRFWLLFLLEINSFQEKKILKSVFCISIKSAKICDVVVSTTAVVRQKKKGKNM